MKIAALSGKDPWALRVERDPESYIDKTQDVRFEAQVDMDSAEIQYHGPEKQHRPYLRMAGRVLALVPVDDAGERSSLVYGIEELVYPAGKEPSFEVFKEFGDAEVAELYTELGFGTEAFEGVPDVVVENDWQLPVLGDVVILGPRVSEEPPVVFVDLVNRTEAVYDESQPGLESGYADVVSAFPRPEPGAEPVQQAVRGEAPVREGAMADLFAGVTFLEPDPDHLLDDELGLSPAEMEALRAEREERELAEQALTTGLVPRGVFEKLFDRHEALNPTVSLPDPVEPEEVVEPDEAERLYDEVVADDVERTASEFAEDGYLVKREEPSEPELAAPEQPALPEELLEEPAGKGRYADPEGIDSQDEDLLERAGEKDRRASRDIDFGE